MAFNQVTYFLTGAQNERINFDKYVILWDGTSLLLGVTDGVPIDLFTCRWRRDGAALGSVEGAHANQTYNATPSVVNTLNTTGIRRVDVSFTAPLVHMFIRATTTPQDATNILNATVQLYTKL